MEIAMEEANFLPNSQHGEKELTRMHIKGKKRLVKNYQRDKVEHLPLSLLQLSSYWEQTYVP